MPTPEKQIHVTIPGELAERIGKLRDKLDTDWSTASYADAVRYALLKGVDAALAEDDQSFHPEEG
jgi:hypothetical protein